MEKLKNLIKEANSNYKTADHLVYVTYSLLKDQKLMLAVIQNLYSASLNAMAALLYYEKLYKRIDALPLDIDSRLVVFETQVIHSYELNQEIVKVIKELKTIIKQHKDSPLEFARKERLIICNDNYSKLKVIDINKLKYYAGNIKLLLEAVNKLENV